MQLIDVNREISLNILIVTARSRSLPEILNYLPDRSIFMSTSVNSDTGEGSISDMCQADSSI